ncbi:MAG: hypothetical protein A2915_03575 [Candidatus Yanofskybacteria bacterium RIFCSPLOWO2_01_FULL_41_34]|uniref:Uncharacterized protein n=1 Tax=Candidatus Yanofskybacteria bacterium RIFCSPHIGHO2_01_FULL_41_26 TaxID=1802661 RepID=A0A1F8EDX8_9BACT|nr:MAG: hypothetical protein A2649_01470 [Candidatus Yanofskybacteria bacterium RIFCSPHIGHO2_01_FULL_41_26]OGN21107.1 MAG: hypothetical protein A2915_03575 [Candidatus Yanofskybacteria bacterium RIFCSPLOWO2_01_FULL_41_34]
MPVYYNNLIQNTAENLYHVSDFKIGNFTVAQALEYLPGFGQDQNWNIVKLILIAISILLSILIAIVIIKTKRLIGVKVNLVKEFLPPQPAISGLNVRWEEIEKHINSTREAEWKFAVIEADKLVDELLKSAGFLGDTMGDRLMNIQPGQLTTLQNLWEAHKIRNRLVHDTNYFLRYTEAKRAVGLYRKTLKELQAL